MRDIGNLIVVGVTLGTCAIASAQIVNTTGAVMVATPPSDVSSNHWESNTQIRAFVERTAFLLTQNIAVDITVPGTSPNSTDTNLSSGILSVGTLVNSYTLHFDVVGTRATNDALEAIGSITFGQNILGIIVLSTNENNSNSVLGLPGVTYSNGPDHGLELTPGGGGTSDVITFGSDMRTITLDLFNASFADDLRVVTAVPEPGSIGLVGVGLFGLLGLRRRRLCQNHLHEAEHNLT